MLGRLRERVRLQNISTKILPQTMYRIVQRLLWFWAVEFALSWVPTPVEGYNRLKYRDILKHYRQGELHDFVLNDSDNSSHGDLIKNFKVDDDGDDVGTDDGDDVQELYLTQRLDHFDPSNTATYKQRYFYTSRYTNHLNPQDNITASSSSSNDEANTIFLLCVGGEGPSLDKSVLIDSPHCSGDMLVLADTLSSAYGWNIHVYALEHRYYGRSYPKFRNDDHSPVTTHNLKYLSSRQALEDLAHFIPTMTKQQLHRQQGPHPSSLRHNKRSNDGKDGSSIWITFGGSYPGYLAAMARMFYPHLVYAAVSNSAPIELKVDYPEYYYKVGWDLRYEKIGGSQQCFDIVKNGHKQAVQLLQQQESGMKSGRQILAEMFNVCNASTALDDKMNQNLLLGDGLIGINAQENDPSCGDESSSSSSLCNIDKLCSTMVNMYQTTNSTELDILAAIAKLQREQNELEEFAIIQEGSEENGDNNNSTCVEIDWNATLQAFSDPKVTSVGWRSWLWQTCTEVGYYQTCKDDEEGDNFCPYASGFHLVDMDLEICQVAFNISSKQVYDNVQATIDHYGTISNFGGKDHSNVRILTVNGNVDPWSTLGIPTSKSTCDMPVKMVPGASHHFWTHPIKVSDDDEIVDIREYILKVMLHWLNLNDSNGIVECEDLNDDLVRGADGDSTMTL